MAVSSLKFRIEGDSTSALRAISDVRRQATDLGGELQRSIGDKLKGVFSVVAVEEMVRRTGEWATELQKTAQGLGMTGESLQTLRVMAERAGVPTEKLFNFYNKLEAAAIKAANGNAKLRASFDALGANKKPLRGEGRYSTAELFQQTLAGASNPRGPAAIQEIYSTKNARQIGMLARESKGKTQEEYQSAHQSQIVPESETVSVARAWQQIGEDLKSIGVTLAPVVHMVLSIVDGLTKMVSGTIATISDQFKDIGKLFSGKMSFADFAVKGVARNHGIAAGAGNLIPQTISGLGNMGSSILGLKKRFNWKWFNPDLSGLSEEEQRNATSAGEAAGTIATFGYGPVARGIGMGARGVESTAGVVGAKTLAGEAGGLAAKMGGTGGLMREGLLGTGIPNALKHILKNKTEAAYYKTIDAMERELGIQVTRTEDVAAIVDLAMSKLQKLPTISLIKMSRKLGLAGDLAMAGGLGETDINNSDLFGWKDGEPPDRRGILSKLGQGGQGGGAGSGNLAIGGTFGVDISSKIMHLNESMVDLLQKIVDNTMPDTGSSSDDGGDGTM